MSTEQLETVELEQPDAPRRIRPGRWAIGVLLAVCALATATAIGSHTMGAEPPRSHGTAAAVVPFLTCGTSPPNPAGGVDG